jgi:hypothetical protein
MQLHERDISSGLLVVAGLRAPDQPGYNGGLAGADI